MQQGDGGLVGPELLQADVAAREMAIKLPLNVRGKTMLQIIDKQRNDFGAVVHGRCRMPDVKMPDARCRMSDARFRMPDPRCQMPDSRFQIPDAKMPDLPSGCFWHLTSGI
jgi:hypothetical protein